MPSSQNATERPIAFVLHDVARNKPQEIFQLTIRPEELTRTEPSNQTVTQTLGGAWLDDGGPGIATVNISGTTGWRGAGEQRDGLKLFQELHAVVFERWHQLRDEVAREGKNPDDVRLIFSDGLDDFSWVVTPAQFTLRRHRSRPLLAMYQINLTKLDELVLERPAKPAPGQAAALSSLDLSISKINGFASKIKGQIASALGPIKAGVEGLVKLTSSALAATRKLLGAGLNLVRSTLGPVMEIARDLSQVSTNVFRMAAAGKDLPQAVKAEFMAMASTFTNVYCLLRNAFKPGGILPNYRSIFGASSCSSTSGGSPASPFINTNVFPLLHPAEATPVSLTASAEQAINQLAKVDVLKAPAPSVVGGLLNTITGGVSVVTGAVDKAITAAKSAPSLNKMMGVASGAI